MPHCRTLPRYCIYFDLNNTSIFVVLWTVVDLACWVFLRLASSQPVYLRLLFLHLLYNQGYLLLLHQNVTDKLGSTGSPVKFKPVENYLLQNTTLKWNGHNIKKKAKKISLLIRRCIFIPNLMTTGRHNKLTDEMPNETRHEFLTAPRFSLLTIKL